MALFNVVSNSHNLKTVSAALEDTLPSDRGFLSLSLPVCEENWPSGFPSGMCGLLCQMFMLSDVQMAVSRFFQAN
jgi:hypothetical protein